jgi:FkbM family methyltransferase
LKLLGFQIKFGLVVTLLICIGILVFAGVFSASPAIQQRTIWAGVDTVRAMHGALLFFTGRSPCGMIDTMVGAISITHLSQYANQFENSGRLIQKENSLELWTAGDAGEYWLIHSPRMAEFYVMLAEQATDIYGKGSRGIRPGDIVLDCGANIGIYTRKALHSGARLVVAIEPGPENIECLERNFSREIKEGKVIIYPKGVWDRNEMLEMNINSEASWGDSFVRPAAGGTKELLPLTTIDQIVLELKLPRIDFIKMDIEGAERRAIAGAKTTIRRFRPRLAICSYHLPDDVSAITAAVAASGMPYKQDCRCGYYSNSPNIEILYFR